MQDNHDIIRGKDFMFYNEVIRPFLQGSILEHLTAKLVTFVTFTVIQFSTHVITEPTEYWQWLIWLIAIDQASGVWASIRSKHVRFRFRVFIKGTLFKVTRWGLVGMMFYIMSNAYPETLSKVEFAGYLGIMSLECISILRNTRTLYLFKAVMNIMYNRMSTGRASVEDFRSELKRRIDEAERQEMKERIIARYPQYFSKELRDELDRELEDNDKRHH